MMKDDIAKVLFTEEELRARVKELADEIGRDYRDSKDGVFCVGILKGALVFYADLVRQIDIPVHFDFMAVSSYGQGTESSGNVRIRQDMDKDVAGKHIIIVEDIIDSGTTMHYLLRHLAVRNPASVKLCSLLSKPSRRKVEVDIDYCGFEVPDEFLVSYGLDYAGMYRNLPYIGILKREIYS